MYTAMSTKYLEAKYFDIHGGGMDLKFHYHWMQITKMKLTLVFLGSGGCAGGVLPGNFTSKL
jgi:hypothetical protein